jgi:beta-lactamase class A
MIGRREFALGTCAMLLATGRGMAGFASPQALQDEFARIEAESGGRLGVAVLDTPDGRQTGHRADERFAMCSTFKLLAGAAVLARHDAGKEQLDRRIRYVAKDLVTYSPVTEKHVATGMTLAELCDAAITLSDNTAGNLLLAALGGPEGLTAFTRTLGDGVTRLDRIEPALNEAVPDDPRDTTTPAAMAANIRALVLGDALSGPSREQLKRWLIASRTGDTALRAGVPAGWTVGDKTGSGERSTRNDVGVIWPPGREPVVVSVYLTEAKVPVEQRNGAIAAVAKAVAAGPGG